MFKRKRDPRPKKDADSITLLAADAGSTAGAPGPRGTTGEIRWHVPAKCPKCGARVDQAVQSVAADPRCGFCEQPLPVEPVHEEAETVRAALQGLGLGDGIELGGGSFTTHAADPSLGGSAGILANGMAGTAVLVTSVPLGQSTSTGQPATGLVLTVTVPGQVAFEAQVGLFVPPEATVLLIPGAVLPIKAVPGHPEAVTVDWDAALRSGPR